MDNQTSLTEDAMALWRYIFMNPKEKPRGRN